MPFLIHFLHVGWPKSHVIRRLVHWKQPDYPIQYMSASDVAGGVSPRGLTSVGVAEARALDENIGAVGSILAALTAGGSNATKGAGVGLRREVGKRWKLKLLQLLRFGVT